MALKLYAQATALFGWFVFAEALPPMWWVGASMLVAGSVIISRRDTEEKAREYTALPRHDEELEEQQLVAVDTGSGSGSGYEEDDAGGQKRRRGA
jgi:methylase of polypeptide subunit release factors